MSETDFEKTLLDASQFVSLFLVFLSVIFGLKYERVSAALREEIPSVARPNERAAFRERQKRSFVVDVLPVAVPSVILAVLLGPASWSIVRTSHFAFPNFDLVRTLFLTVELFIIAAVVWCFVVGIQLWLRASK